MFRRNDSESMSTRLTPALMLDLATPTRITEVAATASAHSNNSTRGVIYAWVALRAPTIRGLPSSAIT